MAEASIFTQILKGEVPGEIIYQDEICFIMMTIAPHNPGHCMVIPVEQVADFEDLPSALYQHTMAVAQSMAKVLKRVYHSPKVALAIVGLEVAHVHVHLFPLYHEAEMNPAQAQHPPMSIIRTEAQKLRLAIQETPLV